MYCTSWVQLNMGLCPLEAEKDVKIMYMSFLIHVARVLRGRCNLIAVFTVTSPGPRHTEIPPI